ncbi:hypothetical protein [Lunatimonas lonarensis]|nr:hypothetical protein [Lunatimonas lonarensis]
MDLNQVATDPLPIKIGLISRPKNTLIGVIFGIGDVRRKTKDVRHKTLDMRYEIAKSTIQHPFHNHESEAILPSQT